MNPHFAACLSGLLPCELEIEIRVEADEFGVMSGIKRIKDGHGMLLKETAVL
ncbi:MAG: hypothetical protein ACTFAL_01980 [Candidatus Electronema sp. V4]|uniref:hypothetical protein n=1 Tax=Candidatus Electronema sp. V4 TaxID=3454756 RepID=UPI00405561A0